MPKSIANRTVSIPRSVRFVREPWILLPGSSRFGGNRLPNSGHLVTSCFWLRTPGKNEKRYIAGALNPLTGRVVWVDGVRKRSQLFIELVHALMRRYRGRRKVHLVLDNYSIHTSKLTRAAIQCYAGRLELHFLPPFCPDENLIEQLWRDLHANVIRNHRWARMRGLMKEVFIFLRAAQPYPGSSPSLRSTC